MAKERCCYLGAGIWRAQPYGKPWAKWLDLGNIIKADETADLETISNPNLRTPGGGNDCSKTRYSAVNAEFTFTCHKDANLEIARLATSSVVASQTVTNEPHFAWKGSAVMLDNGIPSAAGLVVTNDLLGTTTYVLGTDYIISGSGLLIPETSSIPDPIGNPPTAPNIYVDYSTVAQSVIEGFTKTTQEYVVWFDGVNDDTGEKVSVKYLRAKFGPASQISLVGTEYANFDITAELLVDPLQLNAAKSGRAVYYYENAA